MRALLVASSLLAVAISSPGCAHSRADEVSAPDPELEAQMARLRHEKAALEDEVRHLEERLRYFEGDPAAAREQAKASVGGGRGLPVVRLAPDPEQAPERAPIRTAVTLSPVPHSSPYDLDPEPEPEAPSAYAQWEPEADAAPAPTPAPAATGGGEEDVRSYKLVGTRLVDLTKHKRPPAPPKRTRRADRKQRSGIVAQYDAAMAVYKDGRFADAEHAFDSFVRAHPGHDYADNALYWKGEAAYDQEHYADALAAFTEVVERYGGGNKAPDALLKIGLCYGKLGDAANAKDVLTQLIAAYPEARATQIAHRKLSEL